MFTKIVLTIVLISGINCCDFGHRFNSQRLSSVRTRMNSARFEEYEIVPDVIDTAPKEKAIVRYRSGVEVDFGNELTPFSVKDEPSITWPTEVGQYYTLIMTDPDVPNRKKPTLGQVKHWLVINIPANDLSKGETLASYRGSAPPEGSGIHRYIFLIYKQSGYLKHSETHAIPIDPENRKDRINFKVRDFVRKYNLGQPVAGNFYQAKSDRYTRELWAKWNQQIQ